MRNAAPIVALILALGLCSGSGYAAGEDTPAIRKIEQARKAIAAKPAQAEPYNELAQALAGRARETGDTGYYVQAQQAIDQAVRLSPDNLDSEKASIRVLLGQQEFGQALERARALNKKVPDDVLVYGFIVDAASETGLYAEAERAVQWMLDLRSGNIAGLMRAAYMREMFGDVDGATELMQAALQRLPPHETEERAWTMNRIAHLRLAAGKPAEAEPFAREALALFPGYHYALGTLASIKLAQNQPTEALALERQHYQTAPNAGNLYSLAQALRRSGRAQEARNAFAEFEKKALSKLGDADNSNRALVHYYVDVARKPTQALRVATLNSRVGAMCSRWMPMLGRCTRMEITPRRVGNSTPRWLSASAMRACCITPAPSHQSSRTARARRATCNNRWHWPRTRHSPRRRENCSLKAIPVCNNLPCPDDARHQNHDKHPEP